MLLHSSSSNISKNKSQFNFKFVAMKMEEMRWNNFVLFIEIQSDEYRHFLTRGGGMPPGFRANSISIFTPRNSQVHNCTLMEFLECWRGTYYSDIWHEMKWVQMEYTNDRINFELQGRLMILAFNSVKRYILKTRRERTNKYSKVCIVYDFGHLQL